VAADEGQPRTEIPQQEQVQGDAPRPKVVESEFVATMSHELRTPLNIILGYLDLLLEDAFGPLAPEQTEPLRQMEKSARELLELINTTLDLSRLEAGQMTLEVTETDVPDLIHEIEAETRPLQEKFGVSFVCHVPASLPPLHADRLKLKVVLKNLLVNAFKFTDQGSVLVDVYRRNGGLEFCVADTGIGMAPEVVSTIFEPFRQADNSKTRGRGGFGLGLYIVRRLLDVMGGTISIDSEMGRGSIFRAWVPNQLPAGTDAPAG
jgi:signal transduction histidine kinase